MKEDRKQLINEGRRKTREGRTGMPGLHMNIKKGARIMSWPFSSHQASNMQHLLHGRCVIVICVSIICVICTITNLFRTNTADQRVVSVPQL
jgi:hypothetical protein